MVMSGYTGARDASRPAAAVRSAVRSARDQQWNAYVDLCREMDAFDAGVFYSADPIRVDLWNGQRSLNDVFRRPMAKYVQQAMPSLWTDHWMEVEAAAFGWPLVRRVKDALATAFSEHVDIYLIDPATGDRLRADGGDFATLVRRWPHIYEESDLPRAFLRAEALRELHRCAFLWFRVLDGQVVADALPPHAVEVEPDSRVPRDLSRAQWIRVPYAGSDWEADETRQWVHYAHLTSPVDGEPVGAPPWRAAVLDADKQPLVNPDRSLMVTPDDNVRQQDGAIRTGTYPVVGWYATPPDGPYAEPDYALHKAQIGLNLWLLQLNEAFLLGSMGMWAVKGTEPTGIDNATGKPIMPHRSVGYRKMWSLSERETTELLQARAQLDPLINAVEKRLKMEAIARNLPPSTMDLNRQPSNNTGQARMVERVDLEMAKQQRERLLAMDAERALRSWQRCWNLANADPALAMPPDRVGFRVVFRSLPPESFDQSAMQAIQIADTIGIDPRWEHVRVRDRMSVADAMAAVRRNMTFVQTPTDAPQRPAAQAESVAAREVSGEE